VVEEVALPLVEEVAQRPSRDLASRCWNSTGAGPIWTPPSQSR